MNIYHVGPVPFQTGDYDAFVVIADSEQRARERCAAECFWPGCSTVEENRAFNTKHNQTNNAEAFLSAPVQLLGPSSEIAERIVLGSFNQGCDCL